MLSSVSTLQNSARFFPFVGPNCAQRVLIANKDKFNVTEREIKLAKNCGTGRADGNLCGALYIALTLIEDPVKQEKLKAEFVAAAGGEKCKVIRKKNKLSCPECVEKAKELIAKYE